MEKFICSPVNTNFSGNPPMACSMLQKGGITREIKSHLCCPIIKLECSAELNWDIYARFEHRDVCFDEIMKERSNLNVK